MNKKIYFIMSLVLQIIIILYTIIFADTVFQQQIDSISQTTSILPTELAEEIKLEIENGRKNRFNIYC